MSLSGQKVVNHHSVSQRVAITDIDEDSSATIAAVTSTESAPTGTEGIDCSGHRYFNFGYSGHSSISALSGTVWLLTGGVWHQLLDASGAVYTVTFSNTVAQQATRVPCSGSTRAFCLTTMTGTSVDKMEYSN